MKRSTTLLSVVLLVVFGFLAACEWSTDQAKQHQHHAQSPPSTPLTITFKTNPAHPNTGEPVELISAITANDQPVGEAKVEFEVWKQGQKQKHEMISAKMTEAGRYQTSHTFHEDGQHVVVVHVTTPSTHQMINATFPVGNLNATNNEAHDHQSSGIHLHIEAPNEAKAGVQVEIIGHVTKENKPFSGANVQFEYWQTGNSKHEFSDTAEVKAGHYQTRLSFPKPGTYQIKLHVEKEAIHDHTDRKITIK